MNSDPIDQGSEMADFLLQVTIANRGQAVRLKALGACYYCSEKVEGKKLFCNLDCSGDYDKEQFLNKISGRA